MLSSVAFESPQALYVHLPFCRQKCAYCDFTIKVLHKRSSISTYLEALINEIQQFKSYDMSLKTIYFGGGTPSLLNGLELGMLIDSIEDTFDLSILEEWTMEANPEDVEEELFSTIRAHGINRISLGVQSFDDIELDVCKRTHHSQLILEAWETLRKVGFDNLSLDLIYGLPEQNLASWQRTLEQAIALKPEHLSLYSLQIEPKTEFAYLENQARLTIPSDQEFATFYQQAEQSLKQAGYFHYELANWALKGAESKHNCVYWKNLPFLAVGVSSHGYWKGRRYANPSSFREYFDMVKQEQWAWKNTSPQSARQEMEESVFLGLRLLEQGLDIQQFEKRFGLSLFTVFKQELQDLIQRKLLIKEHDVLKLPSKYVLVSNEIFHTFVAIDV